MTAKAEKADDEIDAFEALESGEKDFVKVLGTLHSSCKSCY
jgi:hypothetical protein